MATDDLGYRPCVGIMLINRDGLVWVGNRIQTVDTGSDLTWQMPQGGIDEGETPETAAFRELHEETGTDNAEILAESADWLQYDLPDHLIGKALKGRFRGQTQKWYAMRFLGTDSEFDITRHHQQEFSEWAWMPIEKLPEIVVPFKVEIYRQLVAEFAPYARPVA